MKLTCVTENITVGLYLSNLEGMYYYETNSEFQTSI